ncbi:5407_t:CDS:10 [Entrophospora sp. SA101]|nr:5407_t:CDS:10 [Entrophospora sp. SA101]
MSRYLSNDIDSEGEDDIEDFTTKFQHPRNRYNRYSLDNNFIKLGIVTPKVPSGINTCEIIGSKLIVVMVGLPARGKSYIVKKLKRYLGWLQYDTKIFNVGNLRRNITQQLTNGTSHSHEFFDPSNKNAKETREKLAMESLDELIGWLKKGGRVGIHDATNSTKSRRLVLDANMRLKLSGPDYKNMNPDEALADFRKRVENYEKAYETIGEEEEQTNNIQGYLSGQCIFYLMNFNLESGDPTLTEKGKKYGACLTRFLQKQKQLFRQKQLEKYQEEEFYIKYDLGLRYSPTSYVTSSPTSYLPPSSASAANPNDELKEQEPPEKNFFVWTSLLKRTIQTVENFDTKEFCIMHIRFLNEIYAGHCEEMTYEELDKRYPNQDNNLYFRYPGMGGESYLDVIHRINPLIIELERMTDNVLIVTHCIVLRILLAYFRDVEKEKVPDIDVPLHTLYCLEPKPFGNELSQWKYDEEKDWFFPDSEILF